MDLFKDTYGNRKKKTIQKSQKPTAKQVHRNTQMSMPLIKQTKKSRKMPGETKEASHRSRRSSQAQQHQSSVWQYMASYYKTIETSWLIKKEGKTSIPLRNNCLDGKKTFKSLLTNKHQKKKQGYCLHHFDFSWERPPITGIKKVIPFLKQ